ncbi:uL13 family ribosomal protein [Candidatus Pacearchaeota archaeon]|nr:uL13 family ribosomal protein [Candidatus Pacearchaeota archaeon]
MVKLIYDGKEAVFGRLASVVAKELLKGNSVDIINCGDIIVSGDKKLLAKKILAKKEMGSGGSMKGPKYPRVADRLVKRMIRGMLPRDRVKGQEAFKRLKCYVSESGVGSRESGVGVIKLNHKKPMKFSTVAEIVRLLK